MNVAQLRPKEDVAIASNTTGEEQCRSGPWRRSRYLCGVELCSTLRSSRGSQLPGRTARAEQPWLEPPASASLSGEMNVPAKILRAKDGTEQVVLELADFQALLDAANANAHSLPDVAEIVAKLRSILEADAESVEIGAFLAEYDAVHGKG